jgi:hypothetical protein
MVLRSVPLAFSCLQQFLKADLLEIGLESETRSIQHYRVFRVLSEVLSDLEIRCGSVLRMRAIEPGETPKAYAVVAVRFIWSGALLLRQFVPPKILITNSRGENYPHLRLNRSLRFIACLDHRIKA